MTHRLRHTLDLAAWVYVGFYLNPIVILIQH